MDFNGADLKFLGIIDQAAGTMVYVGNGAYECHQKESDSVLIDLCVDAIVVVALKGLFAAESCSSLSETCIRKTRTSATGFPLSYFPIQ
jgi:hypothetical protein